VKPSALVLLVLVPFRTMLVPAAGGQATPAPQPGSARASPSSPPSAPAQQVQNPDKKVWTNDDIADLHNHSAISTVGKFNTKPENSPGKSVPDTKAKDAKWYHDQILKLQAQIPPLDDKIHQLQAALHGETVDSVRPYNGVRPDDWRDQLVRLQKQRDDIATKIAALQDEARHNGILPNSLP
jgi:hypothetical protein